MWQTFAQAICLVLIIEGILPFLYPARWRQLVMSLSQMSDGQLRIVGLVTMAVGVSALFLIK